RSVLPHYSGPHSTRCGRVLAGAAASITTRRVSVSTAVRLLPSRIDLQASADSLLGGCWAASPWRTWGRNEPWLPWAAHRTLDSVLQEPREAVPWRAPQQPENPFNVHHVPGFLSWDQPHRPIYRVGTGAVVHHGTASIAWFGFQVHPDADTPAV